MKPLVLEKIVFSTVLLDEAGAVVDQTEHEALVFVERLGGGIQLEMVSIRGGTFQMGSLHERGYPDEKPLHLVRIDPFYMGHCPVTQEQWLAVMGKPTRVRNRGPKLPMDNMSYQDGMEFCARLTKMTGRAYALPSEAQWEYACRAGTQTPFSTGRTITTDYANYSGLHVYFNEPPGEYRHCSNPAGTFLPNSFGLQDMHGNLWEYCADRWHEDYHGAPFDGSAWVYGGETGYRVARGGSWHEPPINCRSATRLRVNETERDDLYGFRVAMKE